MCDNRNLETTWLTLNNISLQAVHNDTTSDIKYQKIIKGSKIQK